MSAREVIHRIRIWMTAIGPSPIAESAAMRARGRGDLDLRLLGDLQGVIVPDLEADQVASAQLAVDAEVEECGFVEIGGPIDGAIAVVQ